MAGRQSRTNGDWVIQPESWRGPALDPSNLYTLSPYSILSVPLTVSGDWYNSAGDQMERYREMEFSEKAVAIRGDLFLHLVPGPESTWDRILTASWTYLVMARITRWKVAADDQNDTLSPTTWDLRQAFNANDTYVWQQCTHFTNVYDPTWFTTHQLGFPRFVQQMKVNARYQRRLEGQDNMILLVAYGIFHTDAAWLGWMEDPYLTEPNGATPTLVVTPYLRTYITE